MTGVGLESGDEADHVGDIAVAEPLGVQRFDLLVSNFGGLAIDLWSYAIITA